MMRPVALLVLLLACAPLNGCCTIDSMRDDREGGSSRLPYCGTTHCLEAMQYALFDDKFMAIPNSRVLCFAFEVFDLPLSAAADTLLLPYTVPYTLMHREAVPESAWQQNGQ